MEHAGDMPEHTLFTVRRGNPDETELAVLTTVLLAVVRALGQPADCAGASAPVQGGEVPGRASWGATRSGHRPAVSWSAP